MVIFLLLIGAIVGCFVSFIIFVLLVISDVQFDIGVITNIVIAFATGIAAILHFSSLRKQRQDRLWDINKTILLDLNSALSKAIKASQYYLAEEEARHHIGDPPNQQDRPEGNTHCDFDKKREYALEVYGVFMDKELISAFNRAKESNEAIDYGVYVHGVDHIQAYEESIAVNTELQEKLNFFIAKMSGVNDLL